MCRTCGKLGESFGHLIPLADGGPYQIWNVTIQCEACNHSNQDQPLYLMSLLEEEIYTGRQYALEYYRQDGMDQPPWMHYTMESIQQWREGYYL